MSVKNTNTEMTMAMIEKPTMSAGSHAGPQESSWETQSVQDIHLRGRKRREERREGGGRRVRGRGRKKV